MCHVVNAAIDEAVALLKKRKPSDRDARQCRLPPALAAGTLPLPADDTPTAFEFQVCDFLRRVFKQL